MSSKQHTILVVDDEADVVRSLRDLLRRDYNVLGATSAHEAIDLLKRNEVHVVMTDQRMPDMSGVELLSNVRGQHPDAIRLLFTGYADIRAVIAAINQGNVYRYIAKPWDPDELQTIIRDACEHYDLLVERKTLLGELREANAKLQSANAQLLQANRMKQAFIQVASHELRTPLTILLGLTKISRRQSDVPPPIADFLMRMDLAAERLHKLVDQIVTMLMAQQFEQRLNRAPVDLATVLRQAADDVQPFVELRRQHLDVQVNGDLGTLNLDAEKIRDALNHLLLNAVKFTPDQGIITLRAHRQIDGTTTITVRDTGAGIDPAAQPVLFEPFFTEYDVSRHSSGHYEYGRRGLGLGLSVVRAFIELHGGSVSVASELGKGSTFTVVLPRSL